MLTAIKSSVIAFLASLAAFLPGSRSTTDTTNDLPLPRFVSLDASRANVRVGPGRDYPVKWVYVKSGLPLEIINEYGNWRRIRDWEGDVGWIYHALLSGERTGMLDPWATERAFPMRIGPRPDAKISARLEPRVVVEIEACSGTWCEVALPGRELEGFVEQPILWGAYPRERLNPSAMG